MQKKKFETPDEYVSDLKKAIKKLADNENWCSEELLKLKSLIYPVNAHISFLMGEKFLNMFNLPTDIFIYKNMYDNGFDIALEYNNDIYIAEIKGNIPCGKDGNYYGAKQQEGIEKDINYLLHGKTKQERHNIKNLQELIDNGDIYRSLILLSNNKNAFMKLQEKRNDINFNIYNDTKRLEKDIINIIFLDL